jgi:Arc/MetJ-type ribon-helix-helix transcriptional regulator
MIIYHTGGFLMSTAKVAVTMDERLLHELDRLVADKAFSSRSQAVQLSVKEKLARMRKRRLAEQCAKLNPKEEKALAEEGLAEDFRSWPEY